VKKRKSNKPPVVQAAVIAKRAAGSSINQIAKDLGINRRTVDTILDDAEVRNFVDRGKRKIFAACEAMADVYLKGAKKNYGEAKDFCERLKMIPARPDAVAGGNANLFIGIGNLPRPDFGKPVQPQPETTGSLARTV